MMRTLSTLVLAAVITSTVSVRAEEEPETGETQKAEYIKKLNEDMAEYGIKLLNEELGLKGASAIVGSFVAASFPNRLFTERNGGLSAQLSASCTMPLTAMRHEAVRSEGMKKAMAAKIKRYDCAYGGKKESAFSVKLDGSRLLVTVSEEDTGSGTEDKVLKFLKKKL